MKHNFDATKYMKPFVFEMILVQNMKILSFPKWRSDLLHWRPFLRLGGKAMGNWEGGMTREKEEMGNEEEDSMDQREGISLLE